MAVGPSILTEDVESSAAQNQLGVGIEVWPKEKKDLGTLWLCQQLAIENDNL